MANTVVQPPVADVSAITDPVYQYSSDNGFFTAEFAQTIGTDNAVKFTTNGYSFAWKPENVIYVDSAGNMDVVFGVNASSTAQVWKNRVTYVGTSQITTDEFDCENNQLKHTIRMVAPPRIPAGYMGTPVQMASGGVITYDKSLTVFANGQKQTTDFEVIGDIGFKDAEGNLIYKLPMITAEDANGKTTQGTYKVTFNADGTISFYGMVSWDWLQTAVYPVVIDPTVIVSSAYDTSGNGGRKQVDLPSGRQIAIAINTSATTIYVFKSDDKGTTWAQLCTISGAQAGAAIANVGNNCTVLFNNTTIVYSVTFDGTAVSNIDLNSTKKTVDTQTSISNNVSTASDGNGKLWAVWCSKNSTYPNSFNPRVSSSTDGGSTWATPTQLTTANSTGVDYQNPCIVIRSNNSPTILVQQSITGTNNYYIYSITWSGTAWGSVITVYTAAVYQQQNPCAAVDNNDVIHVVWHGEDATYTATNQIKYSKSTDGGNTWSAMANLTTVSTSGQHQQYPSITIDPNNKLYVYFQGIDAAYSTTYTTLRTITNTSGTWSGISAVRSAGGNQTSAQTLWSKFNMNSSDAVRFMWQDASDSTVKYDSITLNSPPNAPTLTAHGNFDATTDQTLYATFSDPDSGNTMSARQMQIVDVGTGSTAFDSGKVAQTTTVQNQVFPVQLPANTLTNGKQYQWREMTWDNSGASGPWSSYSTFYTAAAPTVTLTAPTANQVIATSSETVSFSYSDPASNAQQSYEVMLYDSTGSALIEDSGTINGTNTQYTLQTALANNTTYVVKVKATNSQGITSATVSQTFSTSFTPPAQATTTATPQNANALIQLSIVNPTTGSTTAYNDIRRSPTGQNQWTRIATNVPVGTSGSPTIYKDYAVASGVGYDYKVTAIGNNGTTSDSTVATNSVVLAGGMWLHDVSDPSGTILKLPYFEQSGGGGGQTPNTEQWTPTAAEMKFAGRKYPVVEFGEAETFQVTRGYVTIVQDEVTWNGLVSLLRNQTTLCLRDTRGRVVFGNVTAGYQETDLLFGRQVTIQITQTDYSVVV